ncbi:MAG TPA: flavodoxin domain-containing protein [Lysobacter sp.]
MTATSRAWLGNALVLAALLVLALAFARWQTDAWWLASPRPGRWLLAAFVLLVYLGICATFFARARTQARSQSIAGDENTGDDAVLLSWASQTGFAQQLAGHTADALRGAGMQVRTMPLHRVDADVLRSHRRALFIASTTGEGDPPDHVLGFTRHMLDKSIPLEGLEYAVLALGDRAYDQFCGFGRRLDQWLHHHGARPLFDRIDVDAGEAGALRHWQHRLGQLSGHADFSDWSAPAYQAWRLRERRWLNEGSVGGPVYDVSLIPEDSANLDWNAGDIAEIGARHPHDAVADWLAGCSLDGSAAVKVGDAIEPLATVLARSRLPIPRDVQGKDAQAIADGLQPLPHREYSIASLPADGSLQLLIRQMRHPDGRLGCGSGWLTAYAAPGARIDLRIRRNPSFHPPGDDRPVVLIGNGTGLAGLRAQLKARIAAGHHRNWLLFGERQAGHDLHYRDEIEAWLRDGRLQELDLAFSRDDPARRTYVQHLLRGKIEQLRTWIAQGASVYVCGSLEGMAPEVDAVLREAVGLDALETMAANGRYCRDVY